MAIPFEQPKCEHPRDQTENRLSRNGVASTVCKLGGSIVWIEDVFRDDGSWSSPFSRSNPFGED